MHHHHQIKNRFQQALQATIWNIHSNDTGKRVVRNNWTVLPMQAAAIATVHELTVACKKYKGITFTKKMAI